jgi:hypothetical protein
MVEHVSAATLAADATAQLQPLRPLLIQHFHHTFSCWASDSVPVGLIMSLLLGSIFS